MSWINERTQHQVRTYPPSRALNLFRQGLDTIEIARQMMCTEAQALELLDAARKAQPRALAAERIGRVERS
jgi:hypothetical protein